jgi:hypothetical protein
MHHDEARACEYGVEEPLSSAAANHATSCATNVHLYGVLEGKQTMLVDDHLFTWRQNFCEHCASSVQESHAVTVKCVQEETLTSTTADAYVADSPDVHTPILANGSQERTSVEDHSIMMAQINGYNLGRKLGSQSNFLNVGIVIHKMQSEHGFSCATTSFTALPTATHIRIEPHPRTHEQHGTGFCSDHFAWTNSKFQNLAEVAADDLKAALCLRWRSPNLKTTDHLACILWAGLVL